MDLTNGQEKMLDIAEMARSRFGTVVFVLGRRSGKGVMSEELIVREIRRLQEGHDPSSHSGDDEITYLTTSGQMVRMFSDRMSRKLSDEGIVFYRRIRPASNRFIIEGKKADGSPSRIVVDVANIKDDATGGGGMLRIYDDIPGDLDAMYPMSARCGSRFIVFRTEYEESDSRLGVLVVQANQRDMNPSLIA